MFMACLTVFFVIEHVKAKNVGPAVRNKVFKNSPNSIDKSAANIVIFPLIHKYIEIKNIHHTDSEDKEDNGENNGHHTD